MARHVWSVLCYRSSIDKYTNVVSLLHVIEKLMFSDEEADLLAKIEREDAAGIQTDMELLSWWVRSDYSEPEEPQMRVKTIAPNGKSRKTSPAPVELKENTGFRLKISIPGIYFTGFGLYWIAIEVKRGERWVEKSRIPLEIIHGKQPKPERKLVITG